MDRLIVTLFGVAFTALLWWLIGVLRRRGHAKVHAAGAVPARLLGAPPAYPGFWQAGRLDVTTGVFTPRGPWGRPLGLGGATILSEELAQEPMAKRPKSENGSSAARAALSAASEEFGACPPCGGGSDPAA